MKAIEERNKTLIPTLIFQIGERSRRKKNPHPNPDFAEKSAIEERNKTLTLSLFLQRWENLTCLDRRNENSRKERKWNLYLLLQGNRWRIHLQLFSLSRRKERRERGCFFIWWWCGIYIYIHRKCKFKWKYKNGFTLGHLAFQRICGETLIIHTSRRFSFLLYVLRLWLLAKILLSCRWILNSIIHISNDWGRFCIILFFFYAL